MQTLPFSEDMEKAVLVGVLSDPSLLPKVSSILVVDDFFKGAHRDIYSVISTLELDQIDSITVGDKLTGASKDYFTALVKESDSLLPGLTNILFYAEQIKGDSRLRGGIDLGREIIATCMEPNTPPASALQKLEDMFARFVQQRVFTDPQEVSTKEAFDEFVESLGHRVKDDGGARTGFYSLDLLLHRLEGLLVLAARPSLGKAQPLTEPVLTPIGFYPMGDIKVGSRVIGSDGEPTTVIGVYPQGLLPTYKVIFSDGRWTECSEDHLWLTQTHNEQRYGIEGSIKSTKQIMESLKGADGRLNHSIPLVKAVGTHNYRYEPLANALRPLHPYLLGVLLGDGSFRNPNIRFTNVDSDILAEFHRLLPEGDATTKNGIDYSIKRKIRNNKPSETASWIEFLGLSGKGSSEKFIPDGYLYGPKEDRLSILQGLFDTDGSVAYKSVVEFSSVSERLAEGVQYLVRSLGGLATISKRVPKYTYKGKLRAGLPAYRVYIRFPNEEISLFRSSKKAEKWVGSYASKRRSLLTIKSIEFVGLKESQCIKVDAGDSLYVTRDFILTHNTALAINIARHVAQTQSVLFFSLEQTREQIFERMLSSEAEVNLEDIRTGALVANKESIRKVREAKEDLSSVFDNLHVDDEGGVTTQYITSISRKKKLEWGSLGLIIIDYLHLITIGSKGTSSDEIGSAVKQLRGLGKELNCPVLLLSQLSRQGETTGEKKRARRPELSDLRGSGDIEQSADVVIFLYRDSYYDDTGYVPDEDLVEVIVRKHRNGRTGITNLKWTPRYVKFDDM